MINDLRKSANTADAVYLAGDPDREGEAISAHLAMVLSKPRISPSKNLPSHGKEKPRKRRRGEARRTARNKGSG